MLKRQPMKKQKQNKHLLELEMELWRQEAKTTGARSSRCKLFCCTSSDIVTLAGLWLQELLACRKCRAERTRLARPLGYHAELDYTCRWMDRINNTTLNVQCKLWFWSGKTVTKSLSKEGCSGERGKPSSSKWAVILAPTANFSYRICFRQKLEC